MATPVVSIRLEGRMLLGLGVEMHHHLRLSPLLARTRPPLPLGAQARLRLVEAETPGSRRARLPRLSSRPTALPVGWCVGAGKRVTRRGQLLGARSTTSTWRVR